MSVSGEDVLSNFHACSDKAGYIQNNYTVLCGRYVEDFLFHIISHEDRMKTLKALLKKGCPFHISDVVNWFPLAKYEKKARKVMEKYQSNNFASSDGMQVIMVNKQKREKEWENEELEDRLRNLEAQLERERNLNALRGNNHNQRLTNQRSRYTPPVVDEYEYTPQRSNVKSLEYPNESQKNELALLSPPTSSSTTKRLEIEYLN